MRDMDGNGLMLCKMQARMFSDSLKETECSSPVFIRRFMNSDFVTHLDSGYYLCECSAPDEPFLALEEQYGRSEYGKIKYFEDQLYWIGYMYRYWCYTREMSSKRLYKFVKPNTLREVYLPYHTLDPDNALERIKEAKGIEDDCDIIARGVECARRLLCEKEAKEAAAMAAHKDEI